MRSPLWSDKGAICPHCQHLNRATDDGAILYSEDTCSFECGSCDRNFRVHVRASWSWTTEAEEVKNAFADTINKIVAEDPVNNWWLEEDAFEGWK
jgi:transcription elongation factor Elf1